MSAAQKKLDYKWHPDNPPQKLAQLHDCIQSLAYRLQTLEIVVERAVTRTPEHGLVLARLGQQVQPIAQDIFEHWAKADPDLDLAEHRSLLQRVSSEFQAQLEVQAQQPEQAAWSERTESELYAVLGGVRGLFETMLTTQAAMQQINWRQLATPRF